MTRVASITREFDEAGAMNALINLVAFVDDGVFLTKAGDLGLVMAMDGVDYECLDAESRDAVTRRFEVALRMWDERTRLYQYLLKRPVERVSADSPSQPVIDGLQQRRTRFVESRMDRLYALSLYLVVVQERGRGQDRAADRVRAVIRSPLAAAREALSTQRTIFRLDADIERNCRQLRQKVDAFNEQLQDLLRTRVLGKSDAFTFFRRLLNYDAVKADAVRLHHNTFLDFDLCDSALECHRSYLCLDDYHIRVLTLKEPPSQTFPHLLEALYEIPSHLILVNEWQREGQAAVRREIHAKRRHFHNAKISLTNYLTDSPTPAADLLVDDGAAAIVRDLGACLAELTLQGRYFGQFTLTVILYDQDPVALDRSVAASMKAFATHDAQVTDERYNLLNAWLAALPGNAAHNLRGMHLLNTNYADLSLLFAHDQGDAHNAHLNREALAVLETTQGTLYNLNLHIEDVGHTLVLGATGSGKSFLLNFLIAHLQRYQPHTLIFDLGGSYKALTECFGGRSLHVSIDRPTFTINPFSLPPTPPNLQFLFAFVNVLMHAGGAHAATRADDQAVYEQIEALYALDPDQRRLFTLANILPRHLAQQLQPWVQGGPYAALFDHAEDTLTLAPFQLVDFEGLDSVPLVLEPVLFYFLHRATATVVDATLANTLKVFVLDEAWRFLRDQTIRLYVTEALKTWRKKNACVLLATQSSEDLERSDILRVAIESCPTKFFLANPQIDRAVYQNLFHLNETEVERIATLIPRQQVLLKQPHVAKVLNLNVDPESIALFSAPHRRL